MFRQLIPAPLCHPYNLPINSPVDGKRNERLGRDCREGEGSRSKPLGQAHGG